jgi:hypothetical protein
MEKRKKEDLKMKEKAHRQGHNRWVGLGNTG